MTPIWAEVAMAYLKGFGAGLLIAGAVNLTVGSDWSVVCFLGAAVSLGLVRVAQRADQ